MAYEKFESNLVLTSSFGIQSIIMLELAKRTGISIPIVTVDIQGAEYDAQRAYRQVLQDYFEFELHIFEANDESAKVQAMNDGLARLGAKAWIDGIRAAQTSTRANKPFVHAVSSGDFVHIHPILDWPDARVDYFLEQMPVEIIHPDFKPGVRSIGGKILAAGEEKKECGLHTIPTGHDFTI